MRFSCTVALSVILAQSSSEAWSTCIKSRRDLLETTTAAAAIICCTALPLPAGATYRDPTTGVSFPEEGEIQDSIPKDWTGIDNPLADGENRLLTRLDRTPDSQFYADPRFVEHVDENAVRSMTEYISKRAVQSGDSVLDLCSSWTSHIDASSRQGLERVAGLGMNSKELEANPSLSEWTIKDLNEDPKLPYKDASFDVVLCQLSIDYLIKPLEVLQEAGRVLRPGGKIHILFSNRLFLQKAVALWTGADDVDHAYTVGCYLHFSGATFNDIMAQDLSTRKGHKIVGDPLYVVSAVKI